MAQIAILPGGKVILDSYRYTPYSIEVKQQTKKMYTGSLNNPCEHVHEEKDRTSIVGIIYTADCSHWMPCFRQPSWNHHTLNIHTIYNCHGSSACGKTSIPADTWRGNIVDCHTSNLYVPLWVVL